jgi:hypothetical protein
VAASSVGDGFFVQRHDRGHVVHGRFSGAEYSMELAEGRVHYAGERFAVTFDESDPARTLEGEADGEVDLTFFEIMNRLRLALLSAGEINYVNCL